MRRNFHRTCGYLNRLPEETDEELDGLEVKLGFALPRIVRFVYKQAGEDFITPRWSVETCLKWQTELKWPEKMVPLAEEGCGNWLCLDCSRKQRGGQIARR